MVLGEPQLGKRGLYPSFNTKYTHKKARYYMDFLQYADGKNDLESIGKKINLDIKLTKKIYFVLKKNKLIK